MLNKKSLFGFSLLVLLATGCGGSGDSSGSSGITGPSYNGAETQATIDENNAQALAVAVVDGANSGDNLEQLGVLFDEVFNNVQTQKSGITAQGTVSGNCGGSATYPDNLDQQTGNISGTVSFYNYCLQDAQSGKQLIVNGQISFMAEVDQNNVLVSMAIEINDFVIAYDGNTMTINSTLAFTQQGTVFEVTTELTGSEGQVLKVENLVISGDPISGVTISSGRIYHPENGYVDISTTDSNTNTNYPLMYDGCENGKPVSGSVFLQGSGGTNAELQFTSCTTYQVCVNDNTTCTPYTWQ